MRPLLVASIVCSTSNACHHQAQKLTRLDLSQLDCVVARAAADIKYSQNRGR